MPFPLIPLQHSNIYGNTGLITESPGELMTDLYGLSTCTTVWKCPTTHPEYIPPMFAFHPLYPFVNMERRRVTIQGGFFIITGEFAGIDGGQTVPIYELCLGLGEDPIEVHPKFISTLGGTPSAPLNNAIFVGPDGSKSADDATGRFDYFPRQLSDGSDNPLGGISSFLDMSQAVWRERFYTTARPSDMSFVGHIESPEGPVPALGTIGGSVQNWLLQALTYEQRGLCYSVTKEWRASGFRGWNVDIYGF